MIFLTGFAALVAFLADLAHQVGALAALRLAEVVLNHLCIWAELAGPQRAIGLKIPAVRLARFIGAEAHPRRTGLAAIGCSVRALAARGVAGGLLEYLLLAITKGAGDELLVRR